MRPILACLSLLLVACPAAGGIDLTWTGCNTTPHTTSMGFDCGDPGAEHVLNVCIQPSEGRPDFIALDAVLDLQVEPLSPFWNFEGPPIFDPACNASGVTTALALPAGCAGVPNIWGLTGASGNSGFAYQAEFRGATNRGRFVVSVWTPRGSPIPLQTGTNYFTFSLVFNTGNAGTCEGCGNPGAIVLNQVTLIGLNLPDGVAMTAPGLAGTCVTFNGGTATTCDATPTRSNTWGRLKTLYR